MMIPPIKPIQMRIVPTTIRIKPTNIKVDTRKGRPINVKIKPIRVNIWKKYFFKFINSSHFFSLLLVGINLLSYNSDTRRHPHTTVPHNACNNESSLIPLEGSFAVPVPEQLHRDHRVVSVD